MLHIEDVSYRYQSRDFWTLKHIDLTMEQGEMVLLAGRSGCGKSTLLRLMLGFEQPKSGAIFYDGQDLSELSVSSVRSQMGVVLQNGQLMSGDIFTNIVGTTALTIKDAWAARSSFLEAIESETKLLDECDVVVPINKIPEFLTFAKSFGAECGLEIKSFGHAGDGNLHVYTCSNDLEEEEFKKRVDTYFSTLYKRATEIGGLVSGEHGIGRGKIGYLRDCLGTRTIGLMFGIKKVFEDGEISNVAVHPASRGRGISRRMLEVLMREAFDEGVTSFTLEVRAGNAPAICLYESFGFRTEGIRPRFYEDPVEDGLVMWLRNPADAAEFQFT